MVVTTDTERLQSYRRMIVELLFAERNHVCAVCVVQRPLRAAEPGYAVGMDHVRFDYRIPALPDRRHRTSASASTTTAASSAPAACGSATRSRARTPGTCRAAARSSQVITDLNQPWGESRQLHQLRQVRAGLPHRRAVREGPAVAEMVKNRDFLVYLVTAREKKQWIR